MLFYDISYIILGYLSYSNFKLFYSKYNNLR
jgi:hypothetical protein